MFDNFQIVFIFSQPVTPSNNNSFMGRLKQAKAGGMKTLTNLVNI
jgi:hypothetical protein